MFATVLPDTVQGWLTLLVAALWIPYLLHELFARKPSLAEQVAAKASKEELAASCDALRKETQSELARLREEGSNRHTENRERLRRLEESSGSNGTHIARVEAKIEGLATSSHILATKLDRLIERLANLKPS